MGEPPNSNDADPVSRTLRIDFHVHSRLGSADSGTTPEQLVDAAIRCGLDGVVVAEHYRVWAEGEAERFSTASFTVFPGAEVTTDLGHVIVVGMKEYPRHRRLEDLAIEARDAGAILVLAHPFRGLFDVGLPEAGNTIHPRLRRIIEAGQVHAIEVENNGCTDSENHAARSLAALAAHVPVAGSDAHVPAGIGRSWTSIPASAATPDSRWLAGAVRGLYERTPWHRGSR